MAIVYEQVVFGVSFIALAIVFLVVYAVAELAIYREKTLYGSTCYKFMFWLGLFEMANCFCYGIISGLMVLAQSNFGDTFSKVISALTCFLFTTCMVMESVLSFNRFMAVWYEKEYARLFKGARFYAWIGFCVACGLSNFVIFLLPGYDGVFFYDKYYWWYRESTPAAVFKLQLFRDAATIATMFFFYILIACKIRKMLAMISNKPRQHGNSVDMQVFAAPFAITVALSLETIYYFIIPNVTDLPPIFNMLSNIWCITVTGVNGVLYIACNQSIRRSCKDMLAKAIRRGTVAPGPPAPARYIPPPGLQRQYPAWPHVYAVTAPQPSAPLAVVDIEAPAVTREGRTEATTS